MYSCLHPTADFQSARLEPQQYTLTQTKHDKKLVTFNHFDGKSIINVHSPPGKRKIRKSYLSTAQTVSFLSSSSPYHLPGQEPTFDAYTKAEGAMIAILHSSYALSNERLHWSASFTFSFFFAIFTQSESTGISNEIKKLCLYTLLGAFHKIARIRIVVRAWLCKIRICNSSDHVAEGGQFPLPWKSSPHTTSELICHLYCYYYYYLLLIVLEKHYYVVFKREGIKI